MPPLRNVSHRCIATAAGIGLLELMLALAIIAALLITATRYYQIASDARKVSEAVEIVQAMYSAGEQWKQTRGDFIPQENVLTEFVVDNLIPSDFVNPHVNPWGGAIVAVADSATQLKLTLTNVSYAACMNLLQKVRSARAMIEYVDQRCDQAGTYWIRYQ